MIPCTKTRLFEGPEIFGPLNGMSDSEGHFGAKKVEDIIPRSFVINMKGFKHHVFNSSSIPLFLASICCLGLRSTYLTLLSGFDCWDIVLLLDLLL
jgi:hypothetical protein